MNCIIYIWLNKKASKGVSYLARSITGEAWLAVVLAGVSRWSWACA
jgi:hypothetical protein